jgi:hypothetical protein
MQSGQTETKSAQTKITLDDLRRNYQDSESADREIFAEQRSNILLVAGEHYNKKVLKQWGDRIRDQKEITNDQKLRLTKNHTYKIMRSYANAVTSYAPSVAAVPQDPKSMQDVKQAELHQKVIQYFKHKHRMREKTRAWGDDFTVIGEVATLIRFDPNKGSIVGYEQKTDEQGQPLFQDMLGGINTHGDGEPVSSDKPVYSGDFVFKTLYGFNLLRPKDCTDMAEAEWLTVRSMASLKEKRKQYENDKQKLAAFNETPDGTYLIFDTANASYGRSSQEQVMICETYYRPSILYPNGYYVFWTEHGIFEEGELPFGIFPIAYTGFDKFQTSPRGRSHIKVLRPFQAEINRAASKLAEHQITLGDDKIIMQAGSKLQQGGILPGVRGLTVTGAPPQVLPGRDGSQFASHVASEIAGMYKASLVDEEIQDLPAQLDPYTLLFRSASQKKKFKVYTERFEQFLTDVYTIVLELSRHYLSDDELLEAVGRDNVDNAQDFRSPEKLCYKIELEPQSDDVETKLGHQITMMQSLQYVGSQLSREDIGKFLKNMPYGNVDGCYDDLTLNFESAQNVMLALDRGQIPPLSPHDDHLYMERVLRNRTRKPDYKMLPQQAQMAYEQRIEFHSQQISEQARQKLAMESDMIPAQGSLVRCDVYVNDPNHPGKSMRLEMPVDALQWLSQRLSDQGSVIQQLESLPKEDGLRIGQMATQPQGAMPPQ